jgi:hypothetical protein
MFHLSKILHVLALGLWFGTAVFFTLMGVIVFDTFKADSRPADGERERWFPVAKVYDQPQPSDRFPKPLRLEQGSRVAGRVVGPLFPWYFGIQNACALLAALTALGWAVTRSGRVHRIRLVVIILGFLGAGAGWWLEREVHRLQVSRNDSTDDFLVALADKKTPESSLATLQQNAEAARTAFGRWHGYSLMVNFATLLLATLALTLAAYLPARASPD